MKMLRKYKVVKTDMPGLFRFECIDAPRAYPIYIDRSRIPYKQRPKVGDVVKFKRYTDRYTTKWILA